MGCHHIASYLACYTYRAVSLLDRDSTVGIQWEFIFSFTRHRDVRKLCLKSCRLNWYACDDSERSADIF